MESIRSVSLWSICCLPFLESIRSVSLWSICCLPFLGSIRKSLCGPSVVSHSWGPFGQSLCVHLFSSILGVHSVSLFVHLLSPILGVHSVSLFVVHLLS